MLNGLLAICLALLLSGVSLSAEAGCVCDEGKASATCASGVCTSGALVPAGTLPDRTGALPPAGALILPSIPPCDVAPAGHLADSGAGTRTYLLTARLRL